MPKHSTTGLRHQAPEAALAFGAGSAEQRGAKGGAVVGMGKGAKGNRRGYPEMGQATAASNAGLLGTIWVLRKAILQNGLKIVEK